MLDKTVITNELDKFQEGFITPLPVLIEDLGKKYMTLKINGLEDKDGYSVVHQARMTMKDLRVRIEKKRKELKEDSLAYGRAIDGEAKRINSLIEPIENYLTAQEEEIDKTKEQIRLENERIKYEELQKKFAPEQAEKLAKEKEELDKQRAEQEDERQRLSEERARLQARELIQKNPDFLKNPARIYMESKAPTSEDLIKAKQTGVFAMPDDHLSSGLFMSREDWDQLLENIYAQHGRFNKNIILPRPEQAFKQGVDFVCSILSNFVLSRLPEEFDPNEAEANHQAYLDEQVG